MAGKRRRGWILTAVLLAGWLSLALEGCAGRQAPQKRYLRIGVVMYDVNDTFLSELIACFREDAKSLQTEERSINVTVRDGEKSQRTEDSCVEELIDGGCDVLCVNLVDRTAPSRIIDMAMERDIPIIFFNREPVKEDLAQWDRMYYVGSDPEESGVMQGELAADYIRSHSGVDRNKDGVIQYVLLEGEPGHQDAIIRTESAVSTLTREGVQLEKLSRQIANWNRAQALTKMSQMMTQYGSRIELVLANNDDMALGAIDALRQAGITEGSRPAVFGIDGTKEGLQAIVDGTMAGTVYHDKEGQAMTMAKLAAALYDGEDLSSFHLKDWTYCYLPYQKVTPENLEKFLER